MAVPGTAAATTFFRPPVRRIEIGMLMIIVRPSRRASAD
jgi:hypothetical protein